VTARSVEERRRELGARTLPNMDQAQGWWALPAVTVLALTATAALPARRALAVAPTEAIRAE
jgi:ABC-type lipoprotein release transport system permease subunit